MPLTSKHARSTLFIAILGCFAAAAAPGAMATTTTFNDAYVLQTSGQNAQTGFSYSTLQAGTWGTYAGGSAVTSGVNGITGSQNTVIVPATPGTPSVHVPGACAWGNVCLPGFTIPGIPGTPAVTADTRTGVAFSESASGRVGVGVNANQSGATISAMLPVATSLTIGDTVDGKFHVSGTNTIASNAVLSATGASFSAGVSGVINMDTTIRATGCVVFAGCSTSNIPLNVNPGSFDVLSVTSTPGPVNVNGVPSVLTNTYLNGDDSYIQLTAGGVGNVSGGSLTGNTLALSSSQQALSATIDLTKVATGAGIVSDEVLNPNIDFVVGHIGGSLLNVKAGVDLGVDQTYAFTPHLMATLLFDRPVVNWVNGVAIDEGYEFTFDVSQGADLSFVDGGSGNLLSRSYFVLDENNFRSTVSLDLDLTVPIRAACLDLDVVVTSLNTCAYNGNVGTDLANYGVSSNYFSLGGFNTASYNDLVTLAVPEPSSVLLMLAGVFGMGYSARRQSARKNRHS